MAVRWKTTTKVPQADYRNQFEWYESNRYKEIVSGQKPRISTTSLTINESESTEE